MALIIGLIGQAHVGKDTSADYMIERLQAAGYRARKIALADQLKIICRELIRMFYGRDVPLREFYDQDMKEMIRPDFPLFAGQPFKLRTVMQQIGTEVFRDLVSKTVWLDYIKTEVLSDPEQILIISDLRMLNEVEYFQRMTTMKQVDCFVTIRIKRGTTNELTGGNQFHISENDLINVATDYTVDNTGNFRQLYQQLDTITNQIRIR
jgi:dephospho-CoA kinase